VRRAAAFALVLGVLAPLAGIAHPVGAGENAAPEPTIALVAQEGAWVDAGGELRLELDIDGVRNLSGVQVALTGYGAVDSRTAFEANLDGEDLGSPLGLVSVPIEALGTTASGTRLLQIGLQSPTGAREPSRLPLTATGVYPVSVELRDADNQVLAGFVDPVVVVEPAPNDTPVVAEKLRVAWVWPLVASPAVLPDGSPDQQVTDSFRPSGRLGRQLAVLRGNSRVPVTLAPSPETLQAWDVLGESDPSVASGPRTVRDVVGTSQVLAGPFVPIDVPSLLAGNLSGAVGDELQHGADVLGSLLETRPDPRTSLPGRLDTAALVRLADTGVDQMIVADTALVDREENLTPAQPALLQAEGRTVKAAVTDAGLTNVLSAPGVTGALRAQRFLASLAVVALEAPALRRGVVVVNPDDLEAAASFYETVLDGLTDHPLLDPVTVDTFLADVPVATQADTDAPVVRELLPIAPQPTPVAPSDWLETSARLEAFASLVPPDDLRVISGDQALLVALSEILGRDEAGRAQATGYLTRIRTSIDDFLGLIRVPDAGRTITLTARTGELPITFLNETEETIRVRVTLRSAELRFPEGSDQEIELPPRSTTIEFPIEARASGTFPVELSVTTVTGAMQIQTTEIKVRSTFVSGVGIFLTVGAGLFLALWWGNDIRRRRKRRSDPVPSAA
jgi:hypothetical protein